MAKITYQRNTTYTITHIYQKDGVLSSAGHLLLFTVKQSQYDADSSDTAAIVKKSITMSGPTNNIIINPGDIADSVPPGTYYFDLLVVESTGPPPVIYPAASGKFILTAQPTNRESA